MEDTEMKAYLEKDNERERNFEAELAEMRSEYRYEDDDRYQMCDAEIQWRAEAAAEGIELCPRCGDRLNPDEPGFCENCFQNYPVKIACWETYSDGEA